MPPASCSSESEKADETVIHLAWGGLFWLAFYIVASELQLAWNHLEGINSVDTTGQIIPLALGSLSLLRSLFLVVSGWKQDKDKDANVEQS